MAQLPTCKVRGVFIGLVEVKGAAAGRTHTSFLEEAAVLLSRYQVEEKWKRTTTDSKGRRKSTSGWKTVASDAHIHRIFVEDDTGAIRVDPEGASVVMHCTFSRSCSRLDPLYYFKGPAAGVANSTGQRRFTEWTIRPGDDLYVLGQASLRDDVVAPEIGDDGPPGDPFIVSVESEQRRSRRELWTGVFVALLALGTFPLVGQLDAPHRPAYFPELEFALLTVALNVALLMLLWAWRIYDDLVQVRNRVEQARRNVDVALKRRFDLIPNLVAVVKALADAESTLQQRLAELRALATPRASAEAVGPRLVLLAESYPALGAERGFLEFQRALVDTEERIALARDYFNEITMQANTLRQVFPESLFAGLAGLRPQEFFEAKGFERRALSVDLDGLSEGVSFSASG